MKPEFKSYEEVADHYRMDAKMKTQYLAYMRARWAATERQHCWDWYAVEWAQRFLDGIENEVSDSIGCEILKQID